MKTRCSERQESKACDIVHDSDYASHELQLNSFFRFVWRDIGQPFPCFTLLWPLLPTTILQLTLTLWTPTLQNGQIGSNKLLAVANELFECVWSFCGGGSLRIKEQCYINSFLAHNIRDKIWSWFEIELKQILSIPLQIKIILYWLAIFIPFFTHTRKAGIFIRIVT